MKNLIILLCLLPLFSDANDPISCGPEIKKTIFATAQTVKAGDWNDPSVWGGKVPGKYDEITTSHDLTATNIIHEGIWHRRTGKITIVGVNESKFVGNSMTPISSDPGIWIMGNGQLDWVGEAKTAWTNLQGSATKGSTTISVTNASGWKIGDEIVVVPTRKPGGIDWNDATNQPIDPMIDEFERRIITGINGVLISFKDPLKYDHLSVTSKAAGMTWTAEVENLTRSIVTEGTKAGRSHIFIMSNKPHTIKFTEGRWLGPRIPGRRAGSLVTGRYGMHFHHCGNGSDGTIVEGNAFHDLGNRVYVPHVSHGITFKDNVAHDMMESPFFWDFQDQTHNLLYDHNIASLRRYNGNAGSVTGFELGQGDNIRVINNVAVYIHHGDDHQQGAFAWNTDNVGIIHFVGNIAHSNGTGGFVWQNDNALHSLIKFISYNNRLAIHHGAYINEYNYIDCIFYNSLLSFEATQGNTNPMFRNLILDGAGLLDYLVTVLASPVPAGQPNLFVNCTFTGYRVAAVQINTELFQGEQGKKIVELISPKTDNDKYFIWGSKSIYGSIGRLQPASGQSYEYSQSGRTAIPEFSTKVWGSGTGLNAKYFNGAAFNSPAFTRVDQMVKFQQWSYDKGASPNEVHHLIKPGGPFSIQWDGWYEPQFSGAQTFSFSAFGGVRFSVDGRMLLDRWAEKSDDGKTDAAVVNMEVGKRYRVHIEHFDAGGQRGIQWYLKRGSVYYNVPVSQLYPDDAPPVQENRPPAVSAGPDITTTDTLFKIEGSASDPDGNLSSVKWSGAGVTLTQDLSDAAHVRVQGKPGKYTLKLTATDDKGLSVSDEMILQINPKVDTTKPDPCLTFDEEFYLTYYPDLTKAIKIGKQFGGSGLRHYELYGKKEGRIINPACIPNFKSKELKDSVTCIDGSVITGSVPAGKYTAATQALADAQALQDLNIQLSKCPVPWFSAPYDGKTLYIFGTIEKPIIRIK